MDSFEEFPAFNFENYSRNHFLEKKGFKGPTALKTGTTICGAICKDGVILGADTRATEGSIVADKTCLKIHPITENIQCCGAGTAADCEMVTRIVSSQVELLRMWSGAGRAARVDAVVSYLKQYLFRYQGYVSAYLIIGGVDCTGPRLVSVSAYGNSDELPYLAMGSGSLAATAVLEMNYRPNMTAEEAKKLVCSAITAGILNDMGSGSQVDICEIGLDMKAKLTQPYEIIAQPAPRSSYKFPKGATGVKREVVKRVDADIVSESVRHNRPPPPDTMDTS